MKTDIRKKITRFYNTLKILYKRSKVANALFLIVFLISISFCAVIFFMSNYFIQRYVINVNLDRYLNSIYKEVDKNIDRYISELNAVGSLAQTDSRLYKTVISGENIEENTIIRSELDNIISDSDIISDVFLYKYDGSCFKYKNKEFLYIDKDFYKDISPTKLLLSNKIIKDGDGKSYWLFGKKLFNFDTSTDFGYMYMFVDAQILAQSIEALNHDGNQFFITLDGMIFAYNDSAVIGSKLLLPGILTSGGSFDDYVYNSHELNINIRSQNNLELISLMSYRDVYKSAKELKIKIGFFALIMLIVSVFLSFMLSRILTASISSLLVKINCYVNGEKMPETVKYKEIAELEDRFDKMIVEIDQLIEKNNIETKKLKDAEMKALQAQINPHFIYNTLDALHWHAKLEKNNYLADMICKLADFFRISLHNGENIITVREELKHVECYIAIEKMRFPELFSVEFDISDQIMEYKMPKLVLQPLVENSIKHGFESIQSGGCIIIRGRKENDMVLLEVEDNGCGIKESPIMNGNKNSGYGVRNVHKRIVSLFGEDYGLIYEARVGGGTRVIIKMGEL